MKERSIIFSAAMLEALLQGKKTQTRRIIKQQYKPNLNEHAGFAEAAVALSCPYGVKGDRLWVKEAWSVAAKYDSDRPSSLSPTCAPPVLYRADGRQGGKFRSPLFMPRWASRITLEISATRIERLHDITESDVRAEGCPLADPVLNEADVRKRCSTALAAYSALWERIHGIDSWERNPWVWVVDFNVI